MTAVTSPLRVICNLRVTIATIAFSLIAFAHPAFARGQDESLPAQATSSWSVLAPHAVSPGDCAVVVIEYERESSAEAAPLQSAPLPTTPPQAELSPSGPRAAWARVTLVDESGATRARAIAFTLDTVSGSTKTREAALLALSPAFKPGDYRLIVTSRTANGEEIRSDTPCTVETREFPSETVELDAANTAIKKNLSPERLAQIDELNEVLFRHDDAALRFSGPFALPLESTRRTSHYAERRIYAYSNGTTERTTHLGIDFGVPRGSPVFAAGDGTVILAKARITTGWTVVIEHLPGVYSLYYHLDSLACAAGETVRTGTLIGKSGSTGLSTGPHLHWEFRVNGEAVSPDWFVGRSLF